MTSIRVTCPHCGSNKLHANSTVERSMEVTGWRQNDEGKLEPEEYGEDEVYWETDTPDDTFICRGCDALNVPLAELIVS
jgi:hypothetical protein